MSIFRNVYSERPTSVLFGSVQEKGVSSLSNGLPSADVPEERWHYVLKHLESLKQEVNSLRAENIQLKSGLASANGKIAFLEGRLEKNKAKIGDLECKGMQNNNVEESPASSEEKGVIDILINSLQIDSSLIYSDSNRNGMIQVDNAYRIGKKLNGKQRPLVVSLTQQSQRS